MLWDYLSEQLDESAAELFENFLRTLAYGVRILLLYPGAHRTDGVDAFIHQWGAVAECIDLVRSEHHDLRDQGAWDRTLERTQQGEFHGAGLTPPCGTFNRLQAVASPNLHPLRGVDTIDIYGLPGLKPGDKNKVREGTLLSLRAAEAANCLCDLQIPR